MKLIIPGAPQDGGDLAKYLSKYSNEIGWMPDASSSVAKDIQTTLAGKANDPAVWISYAATSLQRVWGSLPKQAREAMRDTFSKLVQRGLAGLGSIGDAATASISSVAVAVPVIGMFIQALLQGVFDTIAMVKASDEEKERTAALHFMNASRYTVSQYTHPNSWVLKKSRVADYLNRRDRDWWWKPSFSRSGGGSDLMLSKSAGKADKGSGCKKGIEMHCGTRSYVNLSDCHTASHDPETACERYVMISALFYPFWSTAYPDRDSITEKAVEVNPDQAGRGTFQADEVTANSLLIARQMALLSSPSVNLRVDARRLLRFRDRFETWFFTRSKAFRALTPGGLYAVLPVDRDHIVVRGEGALSIDAKKRKDLPGEDELHQFYLDDDGTIQSYMGVDLVEWGVPADAGPNGPKDVAITIAQYNTVISATLAFMSARANFLRNGPMMKVLRKNFPESNAFDSRVRDAMKYSASVDEFLPLPTTPEGEIPKRKKKPLKIRQVATDGDGAAVAVVGAGLALGLVAYFRR